MRRGVLKLSKRAWYATGGFENSRCFRKADRRGAWRYFYLVD
jgi:hypothetical protein